MKAAKSIKTVWSSTTSSADATISKITADPEWAWAAGAEKQLLEKRSATVRAWLQRSDFWQAFFLEDVSGLRKTFGQETIVHEMRVAEELKTAIRELHAHIGQLSAMHKIRSSHKAVDLF